MKQVEIYNLEFPAYVDELTIGVYKFRRVDNYAEAFSRLQNFVRSFGSEFPTVENTGEHQITAIVEIPDEEPAPVLPWQIEDAAKRTQLQDVLLLLTIFTGRNVFEKNWDGDGAITADHRIHQWGGQLHLSIGEWKGTFFKNKKTSEIVDLPTQPDALLLDYVPVNLEYEKDFNKILELISTEKWQKEFDGGYFLFLFRQAVQRQIIETSFLLCWTIWEHLFAIHNNSWLDEDSIQKMSGDKKIAFILNKYFLKKIDKKEADMIAKLKNSRNRVVHFGKKTEKVSYQDFEMFIRLTEQLVAIILNLKPSNAFNSTEKLEKFLSDEKKKVEAAGQT